MSLLTSVDALMTVSIDVETFSPRDLGRVGVDEYAANCELICLAYRIGLHGPVKLWLPTDPAPAELVEQVNAGLCFHAYNAEFEYVIWNNVLVPQHGFPPLPLSRWRCTMALAASMGLPLALGKCAQALGVDVQKDDAGRRVMLKLSKPRRPSKNNPATRWTTETAPDDFARTYEYCRKDVEVESAIYARLISYRLPEAEQKLWRVNAEINRRGVLLDAESASALLELKQREDAELLAEYRELTGLQTARQVAELRNWLRGQGVRLPDVQRATVAGALKAGGLPESVKRVLTLRLLLAKSSVDKYKMLLDRATTDGRIRGNFQYYAASTGRFGGRGVQFQNLRRDGIDQLTPALELIHGREYETLRFLYGSITEVASRMLRPMLIAPPGKTFVIADWAGIEARVVAWLAGEADALDTFRAGGDIYCKAASDIFSRKITPADAFERSVGKVVVLACGYQGSVGAFQSMATVYGVKVPDDEALKIVKEWRRKNKNIVELWYSAERAAIAATRSPGTVQRAGRLAFRCDDGFLRMRLPSGRCLSYYAPKIVNDQLRITTVIAGGQWSETETYGGKLIENATQAVARDLLRDALNTLDGMAKLSVVLHVHDEIIAECAETQAESGLKKLIEVMERVPKWAAGLPLAAEGFSYPRYVKKVPKE